MLICLNHFYVLLIFRRQSCLALTCQRLTYVVSIFLNPC